MIPVRVEKGPSVRSPVIVVSLIVACTAVFLWQAKFILQGDEWSAYRFALVPAELTGRTAAAAWRRVPPAATLLTSLFLHANLLHLGLNMLFLGLFGTRLEERLGHPRFALFYLTAGVAASLAHVLLDPGARVHLVGASGAIAGVLGAFTALFPWSRVRVLWPMWFRCGSTGMEHWHFSWTEEIRAAPLLVGWLVLQAVFALRAAPGVAWFAHIAGFLFGMVLVWPLRRQD